MTTENTATHESSNNAVSLLETLRTMSKARQGIPMPDWIHESHKIPRPTNAERLYHILNPEFEPCIGRLEKTLVDVVVLRQYLDPDDIVIPRLTWNHIAGLDVGLDLSHCGINPAEHAMVRDFITSEDRKFFYCSKEPVTVSAEEVAALTNTLLDMLPNPVFKDSKWGGPNQYGVEGHIQWLFALINMMLKQCAIDGEATVNHCNFYEEWISFASSDHTQWEELQHPPYCNNAKYEPLLEALIAKAERRKDSHSFHKYSHLLLCRKEQTKSDLAKLEVERTEYLKRTASEGGEAA